MNVKHYILLLGLTFITTCHASFDSETPERVISRSFSDTFVRTSDLCAKSEYSKICDFFVEDYSRQFERNVIVFMNENLNVDNALEFDLTIRSSQELDLYLFEESPGMAAVLLTLDQNIIDLYHCFTIITKNISLEDRHEVAFDDLFVQPQLASMLCARYIQNYFKDAKNKNILSVIVAVTEYKPQNFVISKKGLEFFFTGDILDGEEKYIRISIPLLYLQKAQPNLDFWPNFKF